MARRLLDRLENVFARNISAERCSCATCQHRTPSDDDLEPTLGWGEVLEWVSGRRELPRWPAFDLATLGDATSPTGLGLAMPRQQSRGDGRSKTPLIYSDVPEEYR